jgi:hypothetical protein
MGAAPSKGGAVRDMAGTGSPGPPDSNDKGNANYKRDEKLIAYQLDDLNTAIGCLEDQMSDVRIEIVKELADLAAKMTERIDAVTLEAAKAGRLSGALTSLGVSITVSVASFIAVFKKG